MKSRPLLTASVLFILLVLPAVVAVAHPSAQHRIEVISESIRATPNDQELYIRRGQAYSNEAQLDLALADLRRAESLGDPVLAAFDLGVVQYQLGQLSEARAAFDRFLERFPNHPPALEYRARVARDAGDFASAIADFEAYFALQKNPNPGDYVSAAQMLEGRDTDGSKAALSMLDRGIAQLGIIPQLQKPAIDIERRRGNIAGAIARLESLEPALGASPDWKVDMGELLVLAGRPGEAGKFFTTASDQLTQLRQTEARKALRVRLDRLKTALASSGSSEPEA